MPIESKQGGCIGDALVLMQEYEGGRIVWVYGVEHAYFIEPDFGMVLNTGDNEFPDVPNYTQQELDALIEAGKAYNYM